MRDPGASRLPPRPGRSTECVSSSRCQIVLAPAARFLKAASRAKLGSSKEGRRQEAMGRRQSAVGVGRSSRRPRRPAAHPGGARRDRTDDLMLAKHALSQLSYGPFGVCAPPARGPSRQLGQKPVAGRASSDALWPSRLANLRFAANPPARSAASANARRARRRESQARGRARRRLRLNKMVGLGGLEPPTSRLSSARSNQLSYKPELRGTLKARRDKPSGSPRGSLLR